MRTPGNSRIRATDASWALVQHRQHPGQVHQPLRGERADLRASAVPNTVDVLRIDGHDELTRFESLSGAFVYDLDDIQQEDTLARFDGLNGAGARDRTVRR